MSHRTSPTRTFAQRLIIGMTGAATAGLVVAPVPASASPAGDQIIINEVYANGAGVSGPYLNDYIELYNPSDNTIPLDGMSVVVYSGVSGNTVGTVELEGGLAAGDHYLIKLKNSANVVADDAVELEDFDLEDAELRVPAHNGSIALAFEESTLDLVGFGVTERYEEKAAVAARFDESLSRTDGIDTDHNAEDFTSEKPTPQHSETEVDEEPGALSSGSSSQS